MPTSILDLNGQQLRYSVVGKGPVLMVQAPGWGVGGGLYEHTFGLLERHFTVVYHDPRGSGGSLPVEDPTTLNVGRFVSDMEALRKHLGIGSFALLGHSHGGFIAMNYALTYPQHVTALLPVDAQLGVDEPKEDLQRTLPELARDPRFAAAARVFGAPWRVDTDEQLRAFLDQVWPLYFFDPDSEGAVSSRELLRASAFHSAAMRATSATNGDFLVRDRLGEITAPTLVLVGRHDFICSPVQARAIQAGIPGAQLIEFEHSGHLPWLEEPESFAHAVRQFVDPV
jgi:pimeloyl-ACP methyl ester carboxylesterase